MLARDRDLAQGFTSVGPHRADWRIGYAGLPAREALSRGQEKLTALACVLAQARAYAADCRDWPVVCLDDLASELDLPHQRLVLPCGHYSTGVTPFKWMDGLTLCRFLNRTL